MNPFLTYMSCLIGLCPTTDVVPNADAQITKAPLAIEAAQIAPALREAFQRKMTTPFNQSSVSGNYLAGQFAQRRHDWKRAGTYMERVRHTAPKNLRLLSKSMILYMGSGQAEKAIEVAHDVITMDEDNALALLFLATESFHEKDYVQAGALIEQMPAGSLSEFMMPLLTSWSNAGIDKYDVDALNRNTIHIYHAILIADFLNKKDQIGLLLEKSMTAHGMTLEDVERMADAYLHIDNTKLALELYTKAYEEWPGNTTIPKKIEAIKNEQPLNAFVSIKNPEQGVAQAMHEMAMLLFREYSDDSARIFGNIALFLNPDLTHTKLLLAHIASRNERYDEAITYYRMIDSDNENHMEARRLVAGLFEDTDRIEESLAELEILFREYNDLDSLIQIGDIYRRNKEFGKAIATYNRAEETLGTIPQEYWHLYYVRGMSYEQDGQWQKAEQDLETALRFQPDHPLVMNYLGYAWADQGVNLKKSLELIRKAAVLKSSDGYIIDSLGWVLFRTGKYKESIPQLERAVELLPYDPVINDHLGDAYWQVGRRLEARFQWLRAKNHSENEELSEDIAQKLESGLHVVDVVKEARSETATDTTRH